MLERERMIREIKVDKDSEDEYEKDIDKRRKRY